MIRRIDRENRNRVVKKIVTWTALAALAVIAVSKFLPDAVGFGQGAETPSHTNPACFPSEKHLDCLDRLYEMEMEGKSFEPYDPIPEGFIEMPEIEPEFEEQPKPQNNERPLPAPKSQDHDIPPSNSFEVIPT